MFSDDSEVGHALTVLDTLHRSMFTDVELFVTPGWRGALKQTQYSLTQRYDLTWADYYIDIFRDLRMIQFDTETAERLRLVNVSINTGVTKLTSLYV